MVKKYVITLLFIQSTLFLYSQSPVDKFLLCLEIAAKDSITQNKQPITIAVYNDSIGLNRKIANNKFNLLFVNEIFFFNVQDAYTIENFEANSDTAKLVLRRRILDENRNSNSFHEIIIITRFEDLSIEIEGW